MDLLSRVRQYIRQHALADASTRVVLAVSGGSDSIALAHLAHELSAAGDLQVAGVAHLNHQLRPSADAEEQFVCAAAASLGWSVFTARADVAARARRERLSVEHAAHAARHEFYAAARNRFAADVVALGHTRDDQAETVLLRLLRGAGPRGLAAMRPRRGVLVRPLLASRRVELREYLAARGIRFVEDESNADTSIPRNRVRAELIPFLEARFNPNIVNVLADEADIARETSEWLDAAAVELLRAATRPGAAERAVFDAATLRRAPLAVRRMAVRRALAEAAGDRLVGFSHVDAVLRLLDEPLGHIDLPGQRVDRTGGNLVLITRPAGVRGRWRPGDPENPVNLFSYLLSIPGEVTLAEVGCRLSAERLGHAPEEIVSNGTTATVRADLCGGALTVRNRRPGDRFRPVGVGGRKKLQDFFVDRRVARQIRDRVPVIVDNCDRIVWVAGYGIDEAFRVTDPSQAVLLLKLTQV